MKARIHFVVLLLFALCNAGAQQTPLPGNAQQSSATPRPALPEQLPAAAEPQTPPASAAAQPTGAAASASDPQLKQNPMEVLRSFEPAPDEEYRLGRGDEITVDFAGRPDLQAKLVVGPDGRITLPLAGDIMLAGLTRPQAAAAIQTALSKFYDNLSAQVTVTKYTSNRVLVLGAVTAPGEYTFEGTPTLLAALTRAGMPAGADKIAEIPEECAIYRGNDQVVWVQLKQLIQSGNTLADLRLRRDDVVYVPSGSDRFISVLGEVKNPGPVQLTGSSTIASVLAQAGGVTELAGNNAHVQIVDPSTGSSRVLTFNDILRQSASSSEIALKPGEIVFVPRSGFNKATYVLQRLGPMFALSGLVYLGGLL